MLRARVEDGFITEAVVFLPSKNQAQESRLTLRGKSGRPGLLFPQNWRSAGAGGFATALISAGSCPCAVMPPYSKRIIGNIFYKELCYLLSVREKQVTLRRLTPYFHYENKVCPSCLLFYLLNTWKNQTTISSNSEVERHGCICMV